MTNNRSSGWYQAGCVLVLLGLLGLAASCQGQGPSTPTHPGQGPAPAEIPAGLVVDYADATGNVAGQGVLGLFRFTLDPTTLSATLEPVQRSTAALGDPYTADITGYLAGNPCSDCFKVNGVGLTPEKYVYADYTLRHPFPLPSSSPPQIGDRLDLHVYDVRGIFLKPDPKDPRGMHSFVDLASAGGAPETLLIDNSGFLAGITIDGITTAFDDYTDTFYPTEATAHPYVMMRADTRQTNFDPGHQNGWSDLRNPIGYNVFPQGGGPYTQRVIFTAEPGQSVEYLVVLAANFAAASQGPGLALGKRGNPVYYLPWANMKSPWRVRVEETSNTLEAGNSATDVRLQVTVYDWQHHLGVLTLVEEFRTENQSRSSLLRPSQVLDIEGSLPGVTPMSEVNSGFLAGIGTPQDPLIYEVIFPNTLGADEGTYLGALAIRDNYEASSKPEGVGRGFTPFTIDDYSTYFTFAVQVAPEASGGTTFGDTATVYNNNSTPPSTLESVTVDPGTSGNLGIYSRVGLPNEYLFAVSEVSGFLDQEKTTQVAVSASTNGGLNWGQAQFAPALSGNGHQMQPELVVIEDSTTPGFAWVHMVAAAEVNGDYNVYYSRSGNLGTTWSPPVQVHSSAYGQQTQPQLAVNPLNTKEVLVSMEEIRGNSRIRVCRDENGDGLFEAETFFDQASLLDATKRRRTPFVAFPPASAGEPNRVALIWVRSNHLGPDVMASMSTSGFAGLGGAMQAVSAEGLADVAVMPTAVWVNSGLGLDLLVAYNQQELLSVNGTGGTTIQINASKVMVARRRDGQPVFDTPVQVSDVTDVTQASMPVLARVHDGTNPPVGLVWHDNRNRFTSGNDIFYSVSTDRGATWAPDRLVVGATGHQRYPSLAYNHQGLFRIMYRDENREPRKMIRLLRESN